VEPETRAEKRWPEVVTLAAAIVLQLLLPSRFSLGPKWIVATVELLLLVAMVAADHGSIESRSTVGRAISPVLVAVLVLEAGVMTGRLVVDLVEGGPETNSAAALLRTGLGIWLYTIIAFTFLYRTGDAGGRPARAVALPEFPDLAFPEQLNPWVAPPGWRPEFLLPLSRFHQRHCAQPD